MSSTDLHTPVMLAEILTALAPRAGETIIDATFGAGGYTGALLRAAPDIRVIALDRDPAAIARGAALGDEFGNRLHLLQARFGDMVRRVAKETKIQGVVFDLGVSSPQIDEAGRGFSFRFDGPLDMRMESDGPTATEVVNTLDEESLDGIFSSLGEERYSRRIARAIIAARGDKPITTTLALAEIVRRVVPRSPDGIDPATRTFQALRIYVNDELAELERGLGAAESLLAPGGRLAVVAFHSLEDRIVKQFLRTRAGAAPSGSRHLPPLAANDDAPSFILPQASSQPLSPGEEECARNPRARSARLRFAVRTAAPAWSRAEPVTFPSLSSSPAFSSSVRGSL